MRDLRVVSYLFSFSLSSERHRLTMSIPFLLLDPSLYYGGGECRSARFFSRFIALQIQKESLGYPLQPYLEGRK